MEAQTFLQKTINRILVVLTGDMKQRAEVVRYAVELSRLCGASLIVVCPTELPPPIPYGFPTEAPPGLMPPFVWEREGAKAESALDAALKEIHGLGVKAEGKVVSGAPSSVPGWADKCDLIVVPRTKARGLDRLFGRDTAVDVVRGSACPVMVIEHSPQKQAKAAKGKRRGG